MKKSLLLFIIFLFSILTLTACVKEEKQLSTLEEIQKRDKLIIGVKSDSKPFGYKDKKGEIVGYDIDLAKKITEDILGDETKLELVEVTSSNRIMKLTTGEIDMLISSLTINDQRRNIVNFSLPYFMTGQALMVKKNSKIRSFADLEGMIIGVVVGTTSEQNVREFAPLAIIKTASNYEELYNLLKNNEVNVISSDASILRGFEIDDKNVVLLPTRYTKEYYGIAFRKDEESLSLENTIDNILKKLSKNGFFETLNEKWVSDK